MISDAKTLLGLLLLTTVGVGSYASVVADKSLGSDVPIQSKDLNNLRTPGFDQPGETVEPEEGDSEGRALDKLKLFAGGSSGGGFIKPRLLNTSIALTIPLFSFSLPAKGGPDPNSLANQAIFGLFSLLVTVLVFAVPALFGSPLDTKTDADPLRRSSRSDKHGVLNNLFSTRNAINLMGVDLSNQISLDADKCVKKTICEAHRYPQRYGLLSLPFRMFFPPPTNGTVDARASPFQLAARDGKYTRKDCGRSYKCFFDVLDLATYFVDYWKLSSDPTYVMEA